MNDKDITEKILEDYNDVFADIVNVLMFDGKETVKPSSLADTGVHSQYKADDRKSHELERDVAKYWKRNGVRIALCGLENQTWSDKLMPFRVMGYDGASYRSQIAAKQKTIIPVSTIVLYYGKKHWTGPLSIKEALRIPQGMEPFINDYKINVYEISWLSNEQVSMFKSDFRFIADFFVQRRKNPDYVPADKSKVKHMEEVLKLMSALTGDSSYEDILMDEDAREVKSMCEVADRLKSQGRIEGRAEGITEGRNEERKSILNTITKNLMEREGLTRKEARARAEALIK